ncbi:MAG TPA: ABC transporter permease, partial [Saprospiraceae bacterium]|nr:ABC transporter permease [Saprospiraceae bacterium]
IARLNTTMKYPGASETTTAYSSYPMGPFLQSTFEKEIETFCRLTFIDRDFILQDGATKVTVGQVFAADSTFFRVFDFKLYQGDPLSALTNPQGIVLTKKIAEQIFATPDVLGKTLSKTYVSAYTQHDTTEYFTVSGVLENLPVTSHLQFDALVSGAQKPYWKLWNPDIDKDWHALGAITYLLFRSPETNLAEVEKQIPVFLKDRMQGSDNVTHHLHALADIHLGSKGITDDRYSNFQPFDRQHIHIFGVIGLFILLIAGINYSNLSTILAGRRTKEIAVRKAIGANRSAVIMQFLAESTLTSVLAILIGLGLMWVIRPYLSLLDYPAEAFEALRDKQLLFGGISAVLLFGIAAGAYPAFFIGKTQAARALRGDTPVSRRKKGGIVPVLVTGQFVAAIALIIGTVVCFQQMRYLQQADLGYSTHQILTVNLGLPNLFKSPVLKEKMLTVPGIEAVTLSDQVIGAGFMQQGVRYVFKGKEEHVSIPCVAADDRFVDFYGMQLVAGRAFTKEAAGNGSEYLINETLARKIGWNENATGQQIRIAWMPAYGTVVGVVKDFHFNSLHHKIEPLCFRAGNMSSSISLKVATADMPVTLRRAEEAWKSVITDRPFDYEWLDDQFAQTYGAETR